MRYLIPMNDDGIFVEAKTERIYCDSRFVALAFEKEHYHVLRNIQELFDNDERIGGGFTASNFGCSIYKDSSGKKNPCYNMTRDGFTLLVMGFTGDKAQQFKERYIKRFNDMEKTLKALKPARADFPLLTEQIRLAHDEPKFYHFTNEIDMINRIVLGMTAKQYKEAHNIPTEEKSIRPYLTGEELAVIDHLQMLDAGMIAGGLTFEQRKNALIVSAARKGIIASLKDCVIIA